MPTCDNHPGVEAEHATCRFCLEEDDEYAAKVKADLAAMQSRAEAAERDLARHRAWHLENLAQIAKDGERIKALEARLAEQAPIVDRAEAICDGQERRNRALGIGDGHADENEMCGLVRAMRAARAKRGAGDAARPMAADMTDCPRCGRNHAAYIQGCAVEGRADATGNGWDARGAGEGYKPCL